MEKTRILFTGDSITDANRTLEIRALEEMFSHDPNAPAELKERVCGQALGSGYPLLVASQLGAQEPGKYEILNRGISGNRIVDLDARVKSDCINLKPDVVSILIGINDVWHELSVKNGVSVNKYHRVYDGMLEEITQALPQARLILLEPFVLLGPATKDRWREFREDVDQRRQVVRQLAQKYKAVCLDTQTLLNAAAENSGPEAFTADGVHPNQAGHWVLAQEWLRLFYKLTAQ